MFNVKITEDFLVDTDGTSDGTQLKFYKNGFWYKEDNEGCEGEVEYLVSKILTFSDLQAYEYVVYEQGKINGRSGCRSKTFLGNEDSFVTLERLHNNVAGIPLFEMIKKFNGINESAPYVLNFVKETVGLDIYNYFKKVFTLDYIVLNEDRHFHNLGIIMNGNEEYRVAPIFDNGKSLLNCNHSIKRELPMEDNVKRVIARPFSGSHKVMFDYFGKGFNLDFKKALSWLDSEPDSFYKNVLMFRLNQLKDIL